MTIMKMAPADREVWSSADKEVLGELGPAAVPALDALASKRSVPARDTLFAEGQTPEGLYLLCSGQAQLTICDNRNERLIIGEVRAGDIVGLSTAVSGRPYSVTVETTEPSFVSFIKRDDFLRFLQDHPVATFRMAQLLSMNLDATFEQFRSLPTSRHRARR